MVTLFRVYDDPDLDGELAYEPEDDDDVEAENAHTLSMSRRRRRGADHRLAE
jgi:hypothetical protein